MFVVFFSHRRLETFVRGFFSWYFKITMRKRFGFLLFLLALARKLRNSMFEWMKSIFGRWVVSCVDNKHAVSVKRLCGKNSRSVVWAERISAIPFLREVYLDQHINNRSISTHHQDTMDQLERLQTMDGITIICPKSMMDSAKIPPQIFVEGRPKRQRPTHAGKKIMQSFLTDY